MDELGRAQDRLGRTLDQARAGEDRELAARVRDQGYALVHLLNGVLRMSHMHAADNRAFDQPMADLARALGELDEMLGIVALVCVEDQVYLNEIRIRLDDREGARELGSELLRHGVGGITIRRAPSEPEVRALVTCFARRPAEDRPRAALQAALREAGLEQVELSGIFKFKLSGTEAEATPAPAADLAAACSSTLVDATWDSLGRGRLLNPLPVRRAVTEILEVGPGAEGLLDEPSGSPQARHSLRVCRWALLIGEAIGLDEAQLQDLGMAALLHDVGYAAREGAQGATANGPAVAGFAPPFERHASAGARLLLRQRGFHEAKIRRVRAVLHHHHDAGDWAKPSLFARILRLAEDYDTLQRGGLAPADALARLAGGGPRYDPVLLQAFVNTMGRWPPGSVITLQDGREARVISLCRGPESFARPRVRVIRNADGTIPAAEEVIDLAASALRVLGEPEPPAVRPGDLLDTSEFGEGGVAPSSPAQSASAPPAAPEALLRGELYEGVLPQMLRDVHRRHLDGRLVLTRAGERRQLLLAHGAVVDVIGPGPGETLAAHLVAAAALRDTDVERAQRAAGAGEPLAAVLDRLGLVPHDELARALRELLKAVMAPVLTWEQGEYTLMPAPAARFQGGPAIGLGQTILDAVHVLGDPDVVRYDLGNLDRLVVFSSDPELAKQHLSLRTQEMYVLSAVDGAHTARAVLGVVPLPPHESQRALLGLLCAGFVEYRD